jgi:hypothetical protein
MLILKNICVGTFHLSLARSNEHQSSYNIDLSLSLWIGIMLLCMYCGTVQWFPFKFAVFSSSFELVIELSYLMVQTVAEAA